MPYITMMQPRKTRQMTFDELIDVGAPTRPPIPYDETSTITRVLSDVPTDLALRTSPVTLAAKLAAFNSRYAALISNPDRKSLYRTFYIPKKSGGRRRIDAPCDALSDALRELRRIFEEDFGALYHTSAYAYVHGRCTVDAVRKHQKNGSRWFLKTDFSNFFGSTTKPFVLHMLSMIYPFSSVMEREDCREQLETAIDLCFLNGGLPQGTPISPMLTNLVMIPIDHAIAKRLWEGGFVYTRYADDMQISHQHKFNDQNVIDMISGVLNDFCAPFSIKPEKTRFGSSSGRNFNLGVMLNKDNRITVGFRAKREFKAACHNFIMDTKNGVRWDPHDVQVLKGRASYYAMVEPDYTRHMLSAISRTHRVNLSRMFNDALNAGV